MGDEFLKTALNTPLLALILLQEHQLLEPGQIAVDADDPRTESRSEFHA